MNTITGHQGDVQFIKLDKLPEGLIKIEAQPIALGEHSGHQHCLTGTTVEYFKDSDGNIYAAIGSDGANLQHIHESKFTSFSETKVLPKADHYPVPIPEGVYKFPIQKEFNPWAGVLQDSLD